MNLDQNSPVNLALIFSIALVSVVVLIRNTPATLRINLGKDISVVVEGDKPFSIPEQTQVDCLPRKENSQLCDHQ